MTIHSGEIIPFRPHQCTQCENFVQDYKQCTAFNKVVQLVPGIPSLTDELRAIFSGESGEDCSKFDPLPSEHDLSLFVKEVRESKEHYMKLVEKEMDVNVPEKKVIYASVALERKPGYGQALGLLEYLEKEGVQVKKIREVYGFDSDGYPASNEEKNIIMDEARQQPPPLTDKNAAAGEEWYQKAYHAVNSGFKIEHTYYLKALLHNPNLRLAWEGLEGAARAAGQYDLAENCLEALDILDNNGFVQHRQDILSSP